MGVWGVGIFDNDLSEDVKIRYIELLKEGVSNQDATQRLIEEYSDILVSSPNDLESAEDFWLALAVMQWMYGRLMDFVKEKAIQILMDSQICFEDTLDNHKRKTIEQQWLQKLQGPMPPPKKIKTYKPFVCPWEIGDIFTLPISRENCEKQHLDGGYIAFQKIGVREEYPKVTVPVFHVAQKIFCHQPTIEDFLNAPLLPQFWGPNCYDEWWDGGIFHLDKVWYGLATYVKSVHSYPSQLKYIGNSKTITCGIREASNQSHLIQWDSFENAFFMMYNAWEGIDMTRIDPNI